jgi:hypothetical protein
MEKKMSLDLDNMLAEDNNAKMEQLKEKEKQIKQTTLEMIKADLEL